MEFNVSLNADDVSAAIIESATQSIIASVEARFKALLADLRAELLNMSDSLARMLDLKNPKQIERVKRALTNSLDKWSKAVLK